MKGRIAVYVGKRSPQMLEIMLHGVGGGVHAIERLLVGWPIRKRLVDDAGTFLSVSRLCVSVRLGWNSCRPAGQ